MTSRRRAASRSRAIMTATPSTMWCRRARRAAARPSTSCCAANISRCRGKGQPMRRSRNGGAARTAPVELSQRKFDVKTPFALALLAAIALSSSALADACDDLAAQLKGQIDGLAVGKTAANVIYLSHPVAKDLRLGPASRTVSNELLATSDARKPKPEFTSLVARAAAVIFTVPVDDTLKGVSRCISRMGILRGGDIGMRFRRLDLHCTRTKPSATITISRGKDQ